MNAFHRWLKKWDWLKIGVWSLVLAACLLFWYAIYRILFG